MHSELAFTEYAHEEKYLRDYSKNEITQLMYFSLLWQLC